MANGKFTLGKESGGKLGLVFPDGVSDTEVVLPESGELVTKEYVDNLKTIATGTATFNSTTNNINLTGIGIGIEIGDVIQISGAEDIKNNSEFTVEVITDNNNIIVNQAHANKGTTKNVANRSGDTNVTVKLLAKWYNASDGLGRDWIEVSSIRQPETTYTNISGRPIDIVITFGSPYSTYYIGHFYVNGLNFTISSGNGGTTHGRGSISIKCIKDSTYSLYLNNTTLLYWQELR